MALKRPSLFAWLALAAVAMAFCLTARAQTTGRYCVVDGWGTGEGLLPQSSIISMAQTHDGYLWLGTYNGLVRFDGVHFTVFDESTTPALSSIQIVQLFEDSRSNLWIGTESAGVMLVTNGLITPIDLGQGQRKGRLVSACEDSQGDVWLLTADRYLARYRQGLLDVWQIAGDTYSVGRSVIAEKNGLVWVGTDHSILGFDPGAVQSKKPLPESVKPAVTDVDFLLASRQGGYWRMADGTVEKFVGPNVQRDFGPYPWNRGLVRVSAACEDHEGNLVVGTYGQGVFWFDSKGRATQICTTNSTLANDNVLSLAIDTDDNLWAGMDGGGKADRPLNRVTRSIFTLVEQTAGSQVQSIAEDGEGRLWFSQKNKDFSYLKDGAVTNVESVPFGTLSRFNPTAIAVDARQNIWAATFGASLFKLAAAGFQPARVPGLSPEITALYPGRDGRLWLGTQDGLACFDGQSWSFTTTNDGLSGNAVRAIAGDGAGTLWVGTENGGLNQIRNNKISVFGKSNGFPSDSISCLYQDSQGTLWIGTVGSGLVRRRETGEWTHLTTQDGLMGNSIDYIIEDGDGYLWIGSNAGLMRGRRKDFHDYTPGYDVTLVCRGYDKRDGLPATECTYGSQPAACRTRDGKLWFPTIAGMVWVNPAGIHQNTNPPPVLIESVLVDQRRQNTNGLFTRPLQSVTVPAGRENLEIQYTSLNLADAGRTLFRYQLEGYQTVPTLAGKTRFARYLNLPHGDYVFRVQARNADGIWNETGATLDVIVLPPFWEKWWFRAAVIGALLGIVIATVYFISTQKLQRQLAGMRQQQALERERARIARDIHDQVGARLTQLSLLGEMVEADKDKPSEAEAHARQISQAARETAHELDEIVWTVNPSNDTLDGLVNYICKHAQDYLAVAGLRYRLDIPAHLPPAAISPEARHNVFLAAKESITNIVRHAKASEAWLRLRLEAHSFTLEIEDNGRGPAGSKEKAAESRNGLRNMRKRMEDIGGEFFIGPGRQGGTLVRLTVPLRNN